MQSVSRAWLGCAWAKAQLRSALRVEVQQILEHHHPDLLQPCALCDLFRCVCICDVKLVQLSAFLWPDLCTPDVQAEVFQSQCLQKFQSKQYILR